MDIKNLTDSQLNQAIDNRWNSSSDLWQIVNRVYKYNTALYDMEFTDQTRVPDYIKALAWQRPKVRSNRVFTNTEAVINAIIANPPVPNILPARNTETSQTLAARQEKFFLRKYQDRNVKEKLRKAFRNLYFGRLMTLKVFWNANINDFDVTVIDPRRIRIYKKATCEQESEFIIEEVEDTLAGMLTKFPEKTKEIMEKFGLTDLASVSLETREVTYREAWIGDCVIWQYQDLILKKQYNPYWDWDGLMMTPDEEEQMKQLGDNPEAKRQFMMNIKLAQSDRMMAGKEETDMEEEDSSESESEDSTDSESEDSTNSESDSEMEDEYESEFEEDDYRKGFGEYSEKMKRAYFYNHFDRPRKPYIFGTILNNEQCPIGRTDFISEAAPLQESVDRRKRQFDENAEMMNGITKVDSTVMSKQDAQKLRYETTGIIYGKGVKDGVSREVGQPLPMFIYQDMQDSRAEIDNIMAASSAFRGEREGEETKAGRLALIEQSFLRLNELVQLGDYICQELFNWFYHLAKIRYTEEHYAKQLGKEGALEVIGIMQDDFEDGTEVTVIPGKMLPEDKRFRFERAQADVQKGIISPIDYFKESGYENPYQLARNAVEYQLNPSKAVGLSNEEVAGMVPTPPTPPAPPEMGMTGMEGMGGMEGITPPPTEMPFGSENMALGQPQPPMAL